MSEPANPPDESSTPTLEVALEEYLASGETPPPATGNLINALTDALHTLLEQRDRNEEKLKQVASLVQEVAKLQEERLGEADKRTEAALRVAKEAVRLLQAREGDGGDGWMPQWRPDNSDD